jgi:TetR/AcrR family transcriptional regulator, regulator of cefoperazone and chloramphenicol sensitivity
MNKAISGLGRLISDKPADRDVAEVIWAALRGMVLVEMIMNEPIDWQRERRTLVGMATRYLQRDAHE